MNVAFQAVLIFLLVVPGIIIRYTYAVGLLGRPRAPSAVSEEVVYSVVLACLVHALTAPIAGCFQGVDLRALAALLLGEYGKDSRLFPRVIDALTAHPYLTLSYLISTYVIAAVFGLVGHGLVRWQRLDRRYRVLRFDNPWHYLFTGEVRDFDMPAGAKTSEVPAFVWVNCVAVLGSVPYLYSGVLSEYFFDRSGDLEQIVLRGAARRRIGEEKIVEEKGESARFYPVDADYVSLKYSSIQNLSVEFVSEHEFKKIQAAASRRGVERRSEKQA